MADSIHALSMYPTRCATLLHLGCVWVCTTPWVCKGLIINPFASLSKDSLVGVVLKWKVAMYQSKCACVSGKEGG